MQTQHDKAANLEKIIRLVGEAAADGAKLLVLPECALQGYPYGTGSHDPNEFLYHYEQAETIPGPSTERLVEAARDNGMIIVFGLTELAGSFGPAGLLFNSVATVGPEGVLAVYRKVHTGDVEKQIWHRGADFPVVDTPFGRIGSFICYDLVFPEATRVLALRGAEILVMSTVWLPNAPANPAFELGYDLFTRARALENQVWLLVSGQTGRDPDTGMEYLGHSRVVSPNGEVVLELGVEEGIGVATIDVHGEILRARARGWFGQVFLRDRAPETYGPLVDSSLYAPAVPAVPAGPRAVA
jgi:predicted amidohydrolase